MPLRKALILTLDQPLANVPNQTLTRSLVRVSSAGRKSPQNGRADQKLNCLTMFGGPEKHREHSTDAIEEGPDPNS